MHKLAIIRGAELVPRRFAEVPAIVRLHSHYLRLLGG
jgi:hypothetical protein